MSRITHAIVKGPAACGLLFVLMLVGCATSPSAQPEPLIDRSADTDYELEVVGDRLNEAQRWAARGHRELASSIYDAALEMLAAEAQRERDYVRYLQAAMWGRGGEGRNEDRARELIAGTSTRGALPTQDTRLAADMELAIAVIESGAGDFNRAVELAESAFERLSEIRAWGLIVESRLGLADMFHEAAEAEHAVAQARQVLRLALSLPDEVLIPAATEAAAYFAGAEREAALRDAYEACYRENDAGWRAAVIATAVKLYFADEDWAACVVWGDRLRDRYEGAMPLGDDSGLYAEDLFELMARYAMARLEVDREHRRTRQALRDALAVYADMPEESQQEHAEWKQKLEGALLQLDAD
jgi:hypothetical protein